MQINHQMFEDAVRVLSEQNTTLRQQASELRATLLTQSHLTEDLAKRLIRGDAQMSDFLRVLGKQNTRLHQEILELTAILHTKSSTAEGADFEGRLDILHGKILAFLIGEWMRKDDRQLVAVGLSYAPGVGYRLQNIRKWVREDESELFAEFAGIEKLVAQIVEIAVDEVDAKDAGKHRFIVECTQRTGGRPLLSFALSPRG